jgi:hypothetical protein
VIGDPGDVRPGLQPQGPGERLAANRLLETRRARVQPCATPGQLVLRVRGQHDDTVQGAASLVPHRDYSQECRPAIPTTTADAGAYGHRDRESRPVGHGRVYPASVGRDDQAVGVVNADGADGMPGPQLGRLSSVSVPVWVAVWVAVSVAVSDRMSIRQPVSFAASRTFWASLPMASDSW